MMTGNKLINVLSANRRKAQWVADVLNERADMLSLVGSERLAGELSDLADTVLRMAEDAWTAHDERLTAECHETHKNIAGILTALVERR